MPCPIPIRVGVLFWSSGATSRVEHSQLLGTYFAIQEVNAAGGIDGRELLAVNHGSIAGLHERPLIGTRSLWLWRSEAARS